MAAFFVHDVLAVIIYHLAQQLRNILAVEQEHAMDLEQALGK